VSPLGCGSGSAWTGSTALRRLAHEMPGGLDDATAERVYEQGLAMPYDAAVKYALQHQE